MSYRLLLPVVLTSIIAATALHAQGPVSAYHTERFDAISPSTVPGGRYSGLTGYVAPDGREYALLGGYLGTYIIDVTEKPIRLVKLVTGPPSDWRELKTYRNYAYVVNESGGGLQIIDLSTLPAEPTLVESDSSIFRTGHTITQEGDYIYVHGSNSSAGVNSGTLIMDVAADPLHPALVGSFAGHYVHDATIRNDTMYAAGIMDGKVSIVYLGPDRKSSELIAEISYPGAGTHNSALTTDGSYLMTTDEIGETQKTLKVWDVRDKDAIIKVADFTPEPVAVVHNAFVKGRLAYVSWYSAGTRVIDISDPTQPVEVGHFDAFPGTTGFYEGNWDVYPYLPSGKILSSYMEYGLEVFTFDGTQPGRVHGYVRNSVTNEPLPGAVIKLSSPATTIIADNKGAYKLAGGQGTVNYTAYMQNFRLASGNLELTGAGAEKDILLEPLPLNTYTIDVADDVNGTPITRFAYHINERPSVDGVNFGSTKNFTLPRDSVYKVYVGAWGYHPKVVELRDGFNPTASVRLERGYSENAELNLGWTYTAPTDRAYLGGWERGEPLGVSLFRGTEPVMVQPDADVTEAPGSRAFITGLSDLAEFSRPVFGGSTSLLSPTMHLAGYSDPYINAFIWYSNEGWYQPGVEIPLEDTLDLFISDDEGENWTVLARIGEPTKGWKEFHFRIKDVITPNDRMRFMIRATDSIAPSVVEAGMDEFSVTEGSSALVPSAPHTGSGVQAVFIPNPLSGAGHLAVTLPVSQRGATLELADLLGERVLTTRAGEMREGTTLIPIDVAALPAGRYIWRLRLDDGRTMSGTVAVGD